MKMQSHGALEIRPSSAARSKVSGRAAGTVQLIPPYRAIPPINGNRAKAKRESWKTACTCYSIGIPARAGDSSTQGAKVRAGWSGNIYQPEQPGNHGPLGRPGGERSENRRLLCARPARFPQMTAFPPRLPGPRRAAQRLRRLAEG